LWFIDITVLRLVINDPVSRASFMEINCTGKSNLTWKQKRPYFTKPTPYTAHKTTKYKKGQQKILPSEAVPSVKFAGRNPIKSLCCAVLNRWAYPADKYTVVHSNCDTEL
jgi:hypothetical protein